MVIKYWHYLNNFFPPTQNGSNKCINYLVDAFTTAILVILPIATIYVTEPPSPFPLKNNRYANTSGNLQGKGASSFNVVVHKYGFKSLIYKWKVLSAV